MANANNINIQEQDSLQILVECLKMNNVTNQLSSPISMVPSLLRDVSPSSFSPCVVSIGPLHHGNEHLKQGERLKKTYVQKLLARSDDSSMEPTLKECLNKVNKSISKIRECYVGIRSYNDNELARMMVMDGCFILSFLDSPCIIKDLGSWNAIRVDLRLVENQMPFFVLNDIFECTILKSTPTASLIDLILRLCSSTIFFKRVRINPNVMASTSEHDHILDILYKCYKPTSTIRSERTRPSICTVVELEKAGVSFKPNEDESWLMDINIKRLGLSWLPPFLGKPTIKMPIISIYDDTETFLRNMIAYEQTSQDYRYLTSLVSAFDDLVDSGDDIAKLVESKVIINRLGSNEEAANMINNICKNVIVETFYFDQWQQVADYYNSYWPRHIASLRRRYFNNPWNIIALLAGIILFALTMVQTYFTINPRK